MGKQTKIAVGTVAAAAASIGIGRLVFDRMIAREVDGLFAARAATEPTTVTEAGLAALPEPVQRWLRYAGVVGTPIPAAVRLRQEGEIRLGDARWLPFTAEQYYTTDPPGFVWAAKIQLAPLVTVVGRDKYVGGRGYLEARLLGLVTVAKDGGSEVDRGDLLRYLNETMWFPAAAISPYIAWEPIDATSARATMSYGGVSAPATFHFDEQGRLTTMVANRFDSDEGKDNPWSTPITAHGEFGGVRIPVAGEAVYTRDSGDYPYIRVRVTALEYDRPERF